MHFGTFAESAQQKKLTRAVCALLKVGLRFLPKIWARENERHETHCDLRQSPLMNIACNIIKIFLQATISNWC